MTPMERIVALEKKASEYGWDIYGPVAPVRLPREAAWLLRVARAAVEWREVMPADGDGKPYLVSAPSELLALIAAVEDK